MMADSSRTSSSSSSSFVDTCSCRSFGASSSVFDTDNEQILQGTCEVSGSESPPQNKRCKLTGHFQYDWTLPKYITSSSRNSRSVNCTLCNCVINISHGGINDIKCPHVIEIKLFQQKLKWLSLLRCTSCHLISSMFPDSDASFSCKHTKTKSIICDAIDPHLKKLIIECVRCSPFHLLCDESNERGDTVKLLTVLIRFFDPQKEVVATRHLDTVGIIDLSAKGIFDSIKSLLEKYKLPFSNLLSFTSDTCNTMKGARGGVISKLRVRWGYK